ncbi:MULTISPECIES: DUF2783 domain-containing protein [unclassified Paracoccus (in: a-proteobacteria)]|uniref:DUF2783 domain-containing protein n=1 Tax=unclassified Paracoccus (in: a-proteobacteria) TaxID=2688777 RepID=UPI0021E196AE|nr:MULTISPECIES: DUF2783 domain-containing protein [unclassified Paracoccus (in: a-proteobacteria)]UXU76634.1 DUF2783 domain-containing protein [Paracoccus sp. SMMA_5]UXU82522.1 DUF2783 domain-containing protein [Paracoccus sp. SMMA_5_TC]
MPALNLAPNLTGHDDLYESLVRMHDGLTEAESLRLWARLSLILMNHIGDPAVIAAAIATARGSQGSPPG